MNSQSTLRCIVGLLAHTKLLNKPACICCVFIPCVYYILHYSAAGSVCPCVPCSKASYIKNNKHLIAAILSLCGNSEGGRAKKRLVNMHSAPALSTGLRFNIGKNKYQPNT